MDFVQSTTLGHGLITCRITGKGLGRGVLFSRETCVVRVMSWPLEPALTLARGGFGVVHALGHGWLGRLAGFGELTASSPVGGVTSPSSWRSRIGSRTGSLWELEEAGKRILP